jgi:transposase
MIDVCAFNQTEQRGTLVNEITTVGVDLAKSVISVCGLDGQGRVVLARSMSLNTFARWAELQEPCLIGLEACGSAHHWARTLAGYGHDVRLMPAHLVSPFRMSRAAKNDRNDAQAIAVAVRQPMMRFVRSKSVEQQCMLAWHRLRDGYRVERTALINRTRGLLAELGVWVGRSPEQLLRVLPRLIDGEDLPESFRQLLQQALHHLQQLGEQMSGCEAHICAHATQHPDAVRVQKISGIGAITASACVATITDPSAFRNGRQLAGWIGLVPRQSSTGGKTRLGPITKRGDTYLRGLLVQGARSALQSALRAKPEKRSGLQQWICALNARVGYHKTLVAIANKHARILWVILARGEHYNPDAAASAAA